MSINTLSEGLAMKGSLSKYLSIRRDANALDMHVPALSASHHFFMQAPKNK
jgi:hypothetical protein